MRGSIKACHFYSFVFLIRISDWKNSQFCMDIKMDLSASSPESDDFKVSKISSEFLFLNDFRYVWFAMIEQQAIILTR